MNTFSKPLEKAEEQEYIKRMKKGDLEARNVLIERNLRLVAHIAKKYQSPEEPLEELISIGTFGLIKAIMTYREEKGSKLATYSARCIENELFMYFRSKKKRARDVSLYEQVGTDKEGNQLQFMDIIESEEPELASVVERNALIQQLEKIMPVILTKREQYVIAKRYGLYASEPMTQQQVADTMQISRSYVSRMEKHALIKLRNYFLS
ncbi:RNA polymerase sporulation-specific sigma factor [Lachnospiraceae bacterium XBB1006]|nr:RNA polymerase sporulation-specific sigma factor [Lachnospiraceae bacterium XBB1006]